MAPVPTPAPAAAPGDLAVGQASLPDADNIQWISQNAYSVIPSEDVIYVTDTQHLTLNAYSTLETPSVESPVTLTFYDY